MKKLISLLLVLCMMVPFAAMAEEAAPVKTGLYFSTDLTGSKDGQGYAYIAITGVAVDDNGVITACVIDMIQARINFDENGKLTTDKATEFQSKNELKDGYGMRKASAIGAEWNEQAAAFATLCVGKTAEEVQALTLNEKGVAVDAITSCTLPANEFIVSVVGAVANAEHRGAKAGDVLKLTQVSNASKSKDATETADGQTQCYTHVGLFTLNGDVITSAYIDAVQATVKFNAQGKITSDPTAPVLTKNELKDGYGMKGISPIGKEWYEQAAAFCTFITGKTLDEAIAIATNPSEFDVITSCTIGTEDFLKLIVKSGL